MSPKVAKKSQEKSADRAQTDAPISLPALPPFTVRQQLQTRYAACAAGIVGIQALAYRGPTVLLPAFAPLCRSHTTRMVLFGAHIGCSVVLPLVANVLDTTLNARWRARLFEARTQSIFDAVAGQPELLNNKELETFNRTELSDDGSYLEQECIAITSRLIRTVVNSAIDVLQIYWAIQSGWIVPMAAVSIAALILQRFLPDMAGLSTPEMRAAQQRMVAGGSNFKDNMVIGNVLNQVEWQRRYDGACTEVFRQARKTNLQEVLTNHLVSAQFVVPWAFQGANRFFQDAFPQVTAPLQASFYGNAQAAASMFADICAASRLNKQICGLHEKLLVRQRKLQEIFDNQVDIRGLIKPDQIVIRYKNRRIDARECLNDLEQLAVVGRLTVRGNNQAGKSNLMLLLKQRFQERALYVPTKHELNFDIKQGSSGQMACAIFDAIDARMATKKDIPDILLLDEWSAHLDDENKQSYDALIEKWSRTRTVIEVVHGAIDGRSGETSDQSEGPKKSLLEASSDSEQSGSDTDTPERVRKRRALAAQSGVSGKA